jgi:hypothetical protein
MNSLNATLGQQIRPDERHTTPTTPATEEAVNANQQQPPAAPAAAANQAPVPNVAAAGANDGLGEREDDWLGTLHNIVSFLVLFSIIYYYSSLERFLIIFVIIVTLFL